jgi:nucleotide-binding universal stress UspA family protein
MYENILVGTDGSDTARIAVDQAVELARLAGATLHVMHAFQPLTRTHVGSGSATNRPTINVDQVNDELASDARAICLDAAGAAEGLGVEVEIHAVPGDPADALVSAARSIGADLVVVGNRGMSGKKRFVLGSVPNKVSHHCNCSILIVDTTS